MSALREAAQQFLADYEDGDMEALKHYARSLRTALAQQEPPTITFGEIRAALAQQEQEPVVWLSNDGNVLFGPGPKGKFTRPFYPHPPRREWRGLTEEEIKNAVLGDPFGGAALMSMMRDGVVVAELRQAVERIARAIEAALRSKNYG